MAADLHPGLPPVLVPLFEQGLDGRPDAGPPVGADGQAGPAALAGPAEYAWITTLVDTGGPITRIVSLVTLRPRLAVARRALRRSGYSLGGHFGAYPGIDSPRFVFELVFPSPVYTESHLIPGFRRSRGMAVAWAMLHAVLGFSPAIGGVLTIGVKR